MERERLSVIIKDFRAIHNLTQQDFANLCGISKAYVSILEREMDPNTLDIPKPTSEMYAKLAKGMGTNRDKLIARVEGRKG